MGERSDGGGKASAPIGDLQVHVFHEKDHLNAIRVAALVVGVPDDVRRRLTQGEFDGLRALLVHA
jgi:hypothetical protein